MTSLSPCSSEPPRERHSRTKPVALHAALMMKAAAETAVRRTDGRKRSMRWLVRVGTIMQATTPKSDRNRSSTATTMEERNAPQSVVSGGDGGEADVIAAAAGVEDA